MKLSKFNFVLPPELIADKPSKHRDESRLMVVNRKTQTIEHYHFKDVLNFFDEGDVFVMNDTKVFPALLTGTKEKTNAKITVFLLRELSTEYMLWDVHVDPARKIRIGNKLYFGENDELVAEVIDNTTSRGRTLRFLFDGTHDEFIGLVKKLGETPLPDHIKTQRAIEPYDAERYQTIYARNEGAVVAPAAGFHFSRELLKRAEIKGVDTAFITLHAGLGNFRAIEVEDLTKHKTDSEELIISDKACQIVNQSVEQGRNICVVGTTTMRGVESSVGIVGQLKPFHGWTNRFIFPPYEFALAKSMITNFHEPLSSMFILSCAFGGYDLINQAYKEAIAKKYRFLTYGDAMLIL